MTDPLTWAGIGGTVLAEGVKFLYTQAGEALKRWRNRQSVGPGTGLADDQEAVDIALSADVFDGDVRFQHLDLQAVERLESELRDLRLTLTDYVEGIDEFDSGDERLMGAADGLRRALEAVFGTPITFKGEQRASSDIGVTGEVKVEEVRGYVAALRARNILSGTVVGRATADRVDAGGQLIGVDVNTIGGETRAME